MSSVISALNKHLKYSCREIIQFFKIVIYKYIVLKCSFMPTCAKEKEYNSTEMLHHAAHACARAAFIEAVEGVTLLLNGETRPFIHTLLYMMSETLESVAGSKMSGNSYITES